MNTRWSDWIPGVLNRPQTKTLCEQGLITIHPDVVAGAVDNSSIDLSLSDEGFCMKRGSLKPDGSKPYIHFLNQSDIANKLKPEPDGSYILTSKKTYVFQLKEKLERELGVIGIHGQATAKSSVGRVDVLARLIVDGMNTYESFDPVGLAKQSGQMYLEITPITFNVRVKPGISLSQLRLFYGSPKDAEIRGPELYRTIFKGSNHASDGSLSVDLTNTDIGGVEAAAFCAESSSGEVVIKLWSDAEQAEEPCPHWKFKASSNQNGLEIEPEKFYILRSKERLSVPRGIAIYCRASDETIGEMRIHYAGFVHPLFGRKRNDELVGTPLIFEVRGHQVNVNLTDGEKMANLTFYRMSEDSDDEAKPTPYENQTLQLSKFFMAWPHSLRKVDENGTVEASI
jgi:dCTP deaminase